MYLVLRLAAWCHISRVRRIFDDAELLKIEPRNFISMALNSICFMGRRPNSSMQTTVAAANNNQNCLRSVRKIFYLATLFEKKPSVCYHCLLFRMIFHFIAANNNQDFKPHCLESKSYPTLIHGLKQTSKYEITS